MSESLIFDIGKTNKKVFVFSHDYQVIDQEYVAFDEITDEDGVPCDDIDALSEWIISTSHKYCSDPDRDITHINFSTYGASFVYIDADGQRVGPLYNYLKPMPDELRQQFYQRYGAVGQLSRETASPALDMLNSGLQIYWLKHMRPELYARVTHALHLPQYLSYLLTVEQYSDYTSIGCHTMLWDFDSGQYHSWVHEEGIDQLLAPIVPSTHSVATQIAGRNVQIGVGIHDSSAALLPYFDRASGEFILISTGTWSIVLDPNNQDLLSDEEIQQDCLNYMSINGDAVRASRLFLGEEYKIQVEKLNLHYQLGRDHHRSIAFDKGIYNQLQKRGVHHFKFKYFVHHETEEYGADLSIFPDYIYAYHQLIWDLMAEQEKSISLAIAGEVPPIIFIDGGFADNEVFVEMMKMRYPTAKIYVSQSPIGSALGAAMVVNMPVENKTTVNSRDQV